MSLGDFFVTMSADDTVMTIQPLGTVILMATAYAGDYTPEQIQITNGVQTSEYSNTNNSQTLLPMIATMKPLATNTNYFRVVALGAGRASTISGIEVA